MRLSEMTDAELRREFIKLLDCIDDKFDEYIDHEDGNESIWEILGYSYYERPQQ